MERLNSEGILRSDLAFALGSRKIVRDARKMDSCLLCRRKNVNEAALCDVCYSMLEGDELMLALKWLTGVGP